MKDDGSVHSTSTGFPDAPSTYQGEDDEKSGRDGSNVRHYEEKYGSNGGDALLITTNYILHHCRCYW